MGKHEKITSFGQVELWRDYYDDAELTATTANAFRSPQTSFPNQKTRSEYEQKYTIPLERLKNAIKIAPVMAEIAIYRLTSLLMEKDTMMMPGSDAREASLNNTVMALFKYFNLPSNLRSLDRRDASWINVQRICGLYELTLRGLRQPYKIYLYDKGEKALGFVRHAQPTGEHPVHEYFRTAPDDFGHIPFPTWLATRDIHLRMDILNKQQHTKAERNDGVVARILLHEATHKWANTNDVCYKWDTIAQKNKHAQWSLAPDKRGTKAFTLSEQIKSGNQPSLARDGKAKPLMSMAKAGVSAGEWVYNADSYACAARRLWKEEMKGSSAADWED